MRRLWIPIVCAVAFLAGYTLTAMSPASAQVSSEIVMGEPREAYWFACLSEETAVAIAKTHVTDSIDRAMRLWEAAVRAGECAQLGPNPVALTPVEVVYEGVPSDGGGKPIRVLKTIYEGDGGKTLELYCISATPIRQEPDA